MDKNELQDQLKLIKGKIGEISHKIKNTSTFDPLMEYLTDRLEHLEEEKEEIERLLEE